MRSKTIWLVLWNILFAALLGCARRDRIELKLSLILGDNSDWYRGAVRWKELVETRTLSQPEIRDNLFNSWCRQLEVPSHRPWIGKPLPQQRPHHLGFYLNYLQSRPPTGFLNRLGILPVHPVIPRLSSREVRLIVPQFRK